MDMDRAEVEEDELFTKMEFAVQMTCASCVEAVHSKLDHVPGIRSVYVDLSDEIVLVETRLPSSEVHTLLEDTGRLVVFRGFGGTGQVLPSHRGAAVCALKGRGVGLVRLVQVCEERCLIEATIDGLSPPTHEVKVHEYGDLSNGGESCGDVYTDGHIGLLTPDSTGRASLQMSSTQLKVWNLIGRSIVVHEVLPDGPLNRVLCGVIAKSAGLFQNTKKLCTCDGVTIWEEAKKSKT